MSVSHYELCTSHPIIAYKLNTVKLMLILIQALHPITPYALKILSFVSSISTLKLKHQILTTHAVVHTSLPFIRHSIISSCSGRLCGVITAREQA